MNTLITGGTGFIGSRLALRCRQQRHAVRVLAQVNTEAEEQNVAELTRHGVELVRGSVTDTEAVRRALAGVERVFHLAAAQHEANVPDRYFHEVNVTGTRCVAEAARRAGIRRLVHGSTIGVYGPSADGVVRDDSPLRPDNIYGVTKLAGEQAARETAVDDRLVIVRISETYGPGDRRLLKLFKGIQAQRFFHVGPERNWHHPVYIDDLLDALERAAAVARAPAEPVVLAGPRPVTTAEMVAAIAAAVGVAPPRLRLPLPPLQLAARACETLLRPVGIQPPLHRRRLNFFTKSFAFDPGRAEAALGFAPRVTFEDGARRTAEWYRTSGLLGSSASA